MKLKNESDVLVPEFRKAIIKEIESSCNQARKNEFKRRYDIYKDDTKKYIEENLRNEGLKPTTVSQMMNRCANISLCRKVINKLSRTYSGGVTRSINDEDSDSIDTAVRLLDFDDRMKKSDRYRELHKNGAISIISEPDSEEEGKRKLVMRTLNPWSYDVLEDPYDEEVARGYVFSEYEKEITEARTEANAGVHDQKVGSGKEDKVKNKEYIWWTDSYHFTTNSDGKIIAAARDDYSNPIAMLPVVTNSEEQDGNFWAKGGSDLIDGHLLVNTIITDMLHIARMQGFGIVVITGQNLPGKVEIGPNNAMLLNYDPSKEEERPNVDIVAPNPPLDSWMKAIEQYVALLLTTNNLSPSNVAGKLDASSFPSGVAMMVEMSEATNDTEDKQKDYQAIERKLWKLISAWTQFDDLNTEWSEVDLPPPDDLDITIKFNEIKPVITENEKLQALKTRKELGLDTMVDLIRKDNPNMSEEEAEAKALEIQEEKLRRMPNFTAAPTDEEEENE